MKRIEMIWNYIREMHPSCVNFFEATPLLIQMAIERPTFEFGQLTIEIFIRMTMNDFIRISKKQTTTMEVMDRVIQQNPELHIPLCYFDVEE